MRYRPKPWTAGLVIQAMLLVVILSTTNPQKSPATLLLLPYFLIYGITVCAIGIIKSLVNTDQEEPGAGLSFSQLLFALIPPTLLLMGSFGQMAIRDAGLIVAFICLVGIYVRRLNTVS